MSETAGERRSRMFVDVPFQLRYSIMVAAVGSIISAVAAGLARALLEPDVLVTSALAIVGPAAAIGVVLFLVMVVLTHRVAGPIYVIRRALEELIAGRAPSKRTLRFGDQFEDVYGLVFTLVEAIRDKEAGECAKLREVLAYLPPISPESRAEVVVPMLEAICIEKTRSFSAKSLG
jgi:hypothetical protein